LKTRYLLDTNIVSALVRDPHGPVRTHIARAGEDRVATSIVVACELRYGAERKAKKKGGVRLIENLEAVLRPMAILPLEPGADVHYGRLRAALEARGHVIGANDMLIAAHALALDAILVTDNVKEFRRVGALTIRNWLR
jgi:tRNA(fMet)-specific endonuclease VapC